MPKVKVHQAGTAEEESGEGEEKNIHAGHRKRQKELLRSRGVDAFSEVELLEILLFYSIPRKDTNVIAHHLLTRFWNIWGVLNADFEELCKVKGMGVESASLLFLVGGLFRRFLQEENRYRPLLDSTERIGGVLLPFFQEETREVLVLLCLDGQKRLLSQYELGAGDESSVQASIRGIVNIALRCRASKIVIAHNHVDRVALPSHEDLKATYQLMEALRMIQVELLDHIIVHGDDYVSMRDSGLLSEPL